MLNRNEYLALILANIGNPILQVITGSGAIAEGSTLVISEGDNTLVLPLTNTTIIQIKSISGTVTLDPSTNTLEEGATISPTQNRVIYLHGTVWIEL